jgi:hypothetical protein
VEHINIIICVIYWTIVNIINLFRKVGCEIIFDDEQTKEEKKLSETNETSTEKTTNSRLYLPNIVLYGESTLEEFQHKYKLNETRKIVSTLFPQNNDIITMIVDNVEYSYK